MSANGITFRQVNDADDPAFAGFCATYQEAFGGAPYFEDFSEEEVREVWDKHVGYFIMVAEKDGEVVGLTCCAPAAHPGHDSVEQFLRSQDLPFAIEKAIYMSEVAVHSAHRKQGIGRHLIEARMHWGADNGYTHYVMRTAEEGSNSARIYMRLGAQKADFVQSVDHEGIETSSTTRIYLFGETDIKQPN